jgi:hypothetical protein
VLQEIVLSVCTLIEPAHCKDVHLQIASELGASLQVPLNCMRQGQIEGEKWIRGNPGWRIDRWKCPPASRKRSDV